MSAFAVLTLVTNIAFTVAFDSETRCPAWVAWDIEPGEVVVTNRAEVPFRADPRFAASDNAADYAASGYDRGHMAPAADFNFDRAALRETYLFSNICPQDPVLNRGRWARFEAECRELAASGTVHVVCWPVYEDGVTNRIWRVRVPSGFRKVAWGWFGVREVETDNFSAGRSCGGKEKRKENTK